MTKWHFNAKLYCCCSPEEKLIPGALLSTEKQISGLCGYFNCSFIYFYTYDSPEAEVVTNSVPGNPSLRNQRHMSESSYQGADLSKNRSRHPAFLDMRTVNCKTTTTHTAYWKRTFVSINKKDLED